jgi:hypothetical protein
MPPGKIAYHQAITSFRIRHLYLRYPLVFQNTRRWTLGLTPLLSDALN